MVESAPEGVTGFKRSYAGDYNQSQAKAPLKSFLPLSPSSQGQGINDSSSHKPSTMYGQQVSRHGGQTTLSPTQTQKKPAFMIQSKDDYSGQLMALGKGADTVLIKDMIKKSNYEASGNDSVKPTPADDSRHDSPLSSQKRQRPANTSNGKRRRYIS